MASSTTSRRSTASVTRIPPICDCSDNATMKTSYTDNNPRRKFWTCRKYPDASRCTYFDWDDELAHPEIGAARIRRRIIALELEVDEQKMKNIALEQRVDFANWKNKMLYIALILALIWKFI